MPPSLLETLLHLDKHLGAVIAQYQGWTYGILFLLVFCETGLVVMPFLPGDTLLLAAGLFASPQMGQLDLTTVLALLIFASILGDNTNFWIGRLVGRRLYRNPSSKVFRREHLEKARGFYERHGPKAVMLGKFVAIARTVVPFVAGMDAMEYRRFLFWSVGSAVTWVAGCTLAGYFLGQIPVVRDHFDLLIVAVLGLGGLVIVREVIVSGRRSGQESARPPGQDGIQ